MKTVLTHPSGVKKKVKVGFSWTMLFFGIWVPIFRGDFGGAARIFFLSIPTFGIYALVSCWTYNKRYTNWLMEKGYRPSGFMGRVNKPPIDDEDI